MNVPVLHPEDADHFGVNAPVVVAFMLIMAFAAFACAYTAWLEIELLLSAAPERPAVWWMLCGFVATSAFAGWWGFTLLSLLPASAGPGVSLSRAGISSRYWGPGVLPWEDVEKIGETHASGAAIIGLRPRRPQERRSAEPRPL